MDKNQYFRYSLDCLHLIGLYLLNKEAPHLTIDDKSLSFYINFCKNHSLLALLYQTIKHTKVSADEGKVKKLEEYYFATARKVALFAKERKDLYEYLNENQIDFLPLKGIILKDYYLDSNTREFADNDILFSSKEDKIKEFFAKRDYRVESYKKGHHDVYLKKPFYNFEMHRSLFDDNKEDRNEFDYYKDIFTRAPIKEKYEHYLSKEDFYIYFTAHAFKHYDASGCGVRTLVDYYLYLKNNDLDFNYINQELSKLNLLDFSIMMSSLSYKVFNQEHLNKEEKETLLFIVSSGTYGSISHRVSKGVKEKGKFGYFMSRVFPPFSFYKMAYPWAYKSVILIPIAWLLRFFRIIFKSPKRAVNELKAISKNKKEE